MASPINLDLDFQDYTPSSETADIGFASSTKSHPSSSVVKVTDSSSLSSKAQQVNPTTTKVSGSSVLNILSGIQSKSGISDEALRQLSWSSDVQAQQSVINPSKAGWGLSYLSQYFDVTTSDVLQRIVWSAVPVRKKGLDPSDTSDEDLIAPLAGPGGQVDDRFVATRTSYSYMECFIQSRPDLYGPFWISTTLVFAVAIFSNIVNFIAYRFRADHANMLNQGHITHNNQTDELVKQQISVDIEEWHYSMDEMNTMSSVIMVYVFLVPMFIWFLFWFRGCSKYYTLTETLCAYGYSLSVYIPSAALLMVQFTPFRYMILALAALTSGSVLMFSFLPVAKSDPNPAGSHIILAFIPICHLALGYIIHRVMLL